MIVFTIKVLLSQILAFLIFGVTGCLILGALQAGYYHLCTR